MKTKEAILNEFEEVYNKSFASCLKIINIVMIMLMLAGPLAISMVIYAKSGKDYGIIIPITWLVFTIFILPSAVTLLEERLIDNFLHKNPDYENVVCPQELYQHISNRHEKSTHPM